MVPQFASGNVPFSRVVRTGLTLVSAKRQRQAVAPTGVAVLTRRERSDGVRRFLSNATDMLAWLAVGGRGRIGPPKGGLGDFVVMGLLLGQILFPALGGPKL